MIAVGKVTTLKRCSHSSFLPGVGPVPCEFDTAEFFHFEDQHWCCLHAPLAAERDAVSKLRWARSDEERFVNELGRFVAANLQRLSGNRGTLDLSGLIVPVDWELDATLDDLGASQTPIDTLLLRGVRFDRLFAYRNVSSLKKLIFDEAQFGGRTDLSGLLVSLIQGVGASSLGVFRLSTLEHPTVCQRVDLSNFTNRGVFIFECGYAFGELKADISKHDKFEDAAEKPSFSLSGTTAAEVDLSGSKFLGEFNIAGLRIGHALNLFDIEVFGRANCARIQAGPHVVQELTQLAKSCEKSATETVNAFAGKEVLNFRDAVFHGRLDLSDCFFGMPFLMSTTQHDRVGLVDTNFSKSEFRSNAEFRNRTFFGDIDFSGCKFYHAPAFSGAQLSRDTSFDGAEFRDVDSPRAEACYRILRREMRASESVEEYERFLEKEIESRWTKRKNLPAWEIPMLFLLRRILGYGKNLDRALVLFLMSWVGGGAVYFICGVLSLSMHFCQSNMDHSFCNVGTAGLFWILLMSFRFSILAASLPFSFLANWPDTSLMLSDWHRILFDWMFLTVGVAQSVFSLFLWISVAWAIAWKVIRE